jgi:hypothetical protein
MNPMCDEIVIHFKSGKEEIAETIGDLKKFMPRGIFINLLYSPEEVVCDEEYCLCSVDHYQTAFKNGFTYSKAGIDGEWDAFNGHYHQYV